MLPEWMPNMHPMVVHFPIALILTAFIVDLVALSFRRFLSLPKVSTILYFLGALGTVAAVVSGESAVETVSISGQANSILSDHENVAEITMWFFLIYAAMRVFLWWLSFRLILWVPLSIVGGVGLLPLVQTSSLGGRLVFEQGVGITMVDSMAAILQENEKELVRMGRVPEFSGLAEDGGWQWSAGANAANTFKSIFEVTQGDLIAETILDSAKNAHFAITIKQSPLMITYGSPVSDIELLAEIDRSKFVGSVRLLHHIQDSLTYHYMEIEGASLRLGALVSGVEEVQDEATLSDSLGTARYRVVADQTHFRGYVNGEMMVHGHGRVPDPGVAGIILMGSGTITLETMNLTVLR